MRTAAAFVRLVLVALACTSTVQSLDAKQPGWMLSQAQPAAPLCQTIRLCHSSTEFAYTSVQVFLGLEGLFIQLQVSPATDYVEIEQLNDCITEQCCCNTPVQITIRLPVTAGSRPELHSLLQQYLEVQLPQALDGVVCKGQVEDCPELDGVEPRRQLLGDMDAKAAEDNDGVHFESVGPVPNMPPGFSDSSIALMESSAPNGGLDGTYGDHGASYGYGYYVQQATAASATAGKRRSLLSEPEKQQPGVKPAAGPRKSSTTKNTTCLPCPTCSNQPSSKAQQLKDGTSPSGSCYCRYNAHSASWALEESACRAALHARCGPAGSLLECAHLEAYYAALVSPKAGARPPHVDSISAFLYVDCPPAPPCSCKALLALSVKETEVQKDQCCSDLKAHCQVPFSGLDCAEAVRFCSKSSREDDETVYSFALVKTHSVDCASPQFAAAYTSTTPADDLADEEEVAAMFALKEREAAQQRKLRTGLTIASTFVACCVAVAAAMVGVMALVQQHSLRRCTAPLMGSQDWSTY